MHNEFGLIMALIVLLVLVGFVFGYIDFVNVLVTIILLAIVIVVFNKIYGHMQDEAPVPAGK